MGRVSKNFIADAVNRVEFPIFERNALRDVAKALGAHPEAGDCDIATVQSAKQCLIIGACTKDIQIDVVISGSGERPTVSFDGTDPLPLDTELGIRVIQYWRTFLGISDTGKLWVAGDGIRFLWQMANDEVALAKRQHTSRMPVSTAAERAVAPLKARRLVNSDGGNIGWAGYKEYLAHVAAAEAASAGYDPWPEQAGNKNAILARIRSIMKSAGISPAKFRLVANPYAFDSSGKTVPVWAEIATLWQLIYDSAEHSSASKMALTAGLMLPDLVWALLGNLRSAADAPAILCGAVDTTLVKCGVHPGDPSYRRMYCGLVTTRPDHFTDQVKTFVGGLHRIVGVLREAGFETPMQAALFFRPANAIPLELLFSLPSDIPVLAKGARFSSKYCATSPSKNAARYRHSHTYELGGKLTIKVSGATDSSGRLLFRDPVRVGKDASKLVPGATLYCEVVGHTLLVRQIVPQQPLPTARQIVCPDTLVDASVCSYKEGLAMLSIWKEFPLMVAYVVCRHMHAMRLDSVKIDCDASFRPLPDLDLPPCAAGAAATLINRLAKTDAGRTHVDPSVAIPDASHIVAGAKSDRIISTTRISGEVRFRTRPECIVIQEARPAGKDIAVVDLNAVRLGSIPGWSGDAWAISLRKDNGKWLTIEQALCILRKAASGNPKMFLQQWMGELGLPRYDGIPCNITIHRKAAKWNITVQDAFGQQITTAVFHGQGAKNDAALRIAQAVLGKLRAVSSYDPKDWSEVRAQMSGEVAEFLNKIELPVRKAIGHA